MDLCWHWAKLAERLSYAGQETSRNKVTDIEILLLGQRVTHSESRLHAQTWPSWLLTSSVLQVTSRHEPIQHLYTNVTCLSESVAAAFGVVFNAYHPLKLPRFSICLEQTFSTTDDGAYLLDFLCGGPVVRVCVKATSYDVCKCLRQRT